jgi:hypothetical protein
MLSFTVFWGFNMYGSFEKFGDFTTGLYVLVFMGFSGCSKFRRLYGYSGV